MFFDHSDIKLEIHNKIIIKYPSVLKFNNILLRIITKKKKWVKEEITEELGFMN